VIKAGALDDHERHAQLHALLEKLVTEVEVERARVILRARDNRSELLSADAFTVLATAEAVSASLTLSPTELDWSAAVIGLCKAVEIEVGRLIARPLQSAASHADLTDDLRDKDFKRIAEYCSGRGKPPELGSLAYFLTTAVNSRTRASTSALIASLRTLGRRWPTSDWIFARDGFAVEIKELTSNYRNPAAHTEVLDESHFQECSKLVQGSEGILWKLIAATSPR
jgi:hypothetical protein